MTAMRSSDADDLGREAERSLVGLGQQERAVTDAIRDGSRGLDQLGQHAVGRRIDGPEPVDVLDPVDGRARHPRRRCVALELHPAADRARERRDAVLEVDEVVPVPLPCGDVRLGHRCAVGAVLAERHPERGRRGHEVQEADRHAVGDAAREDRLAALDRGHLDHLASPRSPVRLPDVERC
jgi:hypothetical protein